MKNERINKIISEQSDVILCKSKANNEIYATTDGERFENITKGICGRIEKESVSGLFTIPIRINHMQQQNKNLIKLISQLGLAIEQ